MLNRLRDKALRAALPLLATSAVGRLAINKGLELLAERTGLPITGEYRAEQESWCIHIGEPGAPMQAELQVSNDSLADIIEELTPYLLNKQELSASQILAMLRPHLHGTCREK